MARSIDFNAEIPSSPTGYWSDKDGKHYEPDSLFPEYGASLIQPHQMSPDEFASHPYAVMHSSMLNPALPQKRVFKHPLEEETAFENGVAAHLGSAAAAMERAINVNYHGGSEGAWWAESRYRKTGLGRGDLPTRPGRATTFHTFWAIPSASEIKDVETDDEANRTTHLGRTDIKISNEYYSNATEDPGVLSLAARRQQSLVTQADFVRDALAQGKEKEIHPETLHLYNQGTLGMKQLSPDEVDEINQRARLDVENKVTEFNKFNKLNRRSANGGEGHVESLNHTGQLELPGLRSPFGKSPSFLKPHPSPPPVTSRYVTPLDTYKDGMPLYRYEDEEVRRPAKIESIAKSLASKGIPDVKPDIDKIRSRFDLDSEQGGGYRRMVLTRPNNNIINNVFSKQFKSHLEKKAWEKVYSRYPSTFISQPWTLKNYIYNQILEENASRSPSSPDVTPREKRPPTGKPVAKSVGKLAPKVVAKSVIKAAGQTASEL